jgi:hypothetical protein
MRGDFVGHRGRRFTKYFGQRKIAFGKQLCSCHGGAKNSVSFSLQSRLVPFYTSCNLFLQRGETERVS